MELYQELLITILARQDIQISFPNLPTVSSAELIDAISYQVLLRIKAILEDDVLTDPECFEQIEAIIRVFEKFGSSGGNRHDF